MSDGNLHRVTDRTPEVTVATTGGPGTFVAWFTGLSGSGKSNHLPASTLPTKNRRKAGPRTTEPGVPGFDRPDTLRQGADLGEGVADFNALGFDLAFDPSERTQDFV